MGNFIRLIISFIQLNWKYWNSLLRSFYFCYRILPLREAIKCPIYISNNTILKIGKNVKVIFTHSIHAGMIKIGYTQATFWSKQNKSIIDIADCTIIFNGYANIGSGAQISIAGGGNLEFGNQFWSTGPILIICRKHIVFKNNNVLSWNITIMDHDAHDIIMDNLVLNSPQNIEIGEHVWIGINSIVLKGAYISANSIVAAGSLITSGIYPQNSIISNKNRILKSHVTWK